MVLAWAMLCFPQSLWQRVSRPRRLTSVKLSLYLRKYNDYERKAAKKGKALHLEKIDRRTRQQAAIRRTVRSIRH
jgi:hypothetical protein